MSAIPCASVNLKTMADGTLRISFDVEPNNAQDAFKLFASPGTPAVLAALKVGYAAVQNQPLAPVGCAESATPFVAPKKTGPLCLLAVRFCTDPLFQEWATEHFGYTIGTADETAEMIRTVCNIDSRADLDRNEFATEAFHEQLRKPFIGWRSLKGL